MKFTMIAAAALCVAFAGCSKEEAQPAAPEAPAVKQEAAAAVETVKKAATEAVDALKKAADAATK